MALTLLLGGARAGKSRMAVDLARRHAGPVVFIATAEPRDDEMAERITRHKAARPAEWITVEEPHDLAGAVASAPANALVLIDCLTLWVSNLLEARVSAENLEARAASAASLASQRPATTIAVSNEVGLGLVPANPIARHYRDLLGRVNAIWADAASEAALVVAGRILPLSRPDTFDHG